MEQNNRIEQNKIEQDRSLQDRTEKDGTSLKTVDQNSEHYRTDKEKKTNKQDLVSSYIQHFQPVINQTYGYV